MPTFMDSLRANPIGNPASSSGSSGIFGQPGQTSNRDALNMVSELKDREMQDFERKANFMSDLSFRQEQRMRAMFPPETANGGNQPQDTSKMNTVMAQDPNQMTGYQKADIGVRQGQQNLESQKMAQQGKLGQEAIDIKTQQEKLNQQKSDQINEQKKADMQRKIDEADAKIEQAKAALSAKNANQQAQLEAHKAYSDAIEERHKLEMAQKDDQFKKTNELHQKAMDALEEKLKQAGRSKTTTEVNPDGTKKTVTTEKGSAADTVNVIGKDGKPYTIPKDKMNDMDADGTPHWKPAGGDQSNESGE